MPGTLPPTPPESLTAPPSSITSEPILELAPRTDLSSAALTPGPSSVANRVSAISSDPCLSMPASRTATTQLARLNNRVAPFSFFLTAAEGILLWFLLFFLFADICPPFFARYVCQACRDGCDN